MLCGSVYVLGHDLSNHILCIHAGLNIMALREEREDSMIRPCNKTDRDAIYAIINEAAEAYRGVIPADRWHEPYKSRDELGEEIAQGVGFWCLGEEGELLGVMGIQDRGDVTLIRHAYVRPDRQQRGIGSRLLAHLEGLTDKPILVGTWADARWAIGFYERNGYRLVTPEEKDHLLRKYWSIPERQVETSVVLANAAWLQAQRG